MALTAAEKQKRYRERKNRSGAAGTPPPAKRTRAKAAASRKAKTPKSAIGTTLAECEKNVLRLQRQAEAAAADPECSHQGRASIGNAVKAALAQLATLRGEDELTEAKILRSPAMASLVELLDRVMVAHPGPWIRALREGIEALP